MVSQGRHTAPSTAFVLLRGAQTMHHQQTKHLLVSYSVQRLGFFRSQKRGA